MRALLASDVSTAARVLYLYPDAMREAVCQRLIRNADWADRYTRRLGRAHPLWGNGTLLAAARAHAVAAEPTFDDVAYCSCFEIVLKLLADRRRRHDL